MWIFVYCVLSALILVGFLHEDRIVELENRFCRWVRGRVNERRAERLRGQGYAVCEIPADCEAAFVVRVRK